MQAPSAIDHFFDFEGRLRIVTRALRRVGLWPSNRNFFGLNIYTLGTVSMLFSTNLHYLFQVIQWFHVAGDVEAISSSALIVIAEILTNVKVLCLVKYQFAIERLLRTSNKPVFQPRTIKQRKAVAWIFDVFKYFFISFSVGANILTLLWSIHPLLDKTQDKHLPFIAWYPLDNTEPVPFVLTYLHQVISIVFMGQTHIQVDCLSLGLMAMVVVQCEILADSLRSIGAKRKDGQEEALYDCIQHHKEILEYFETVYNMLSICVFGQYIISAVTLCLTMFQMTFVNPESSKFLLLVGYELGMLGQLFIYCWWSNEVINKSEQLTLAAFQSNWLGTSRQHKQNLLFFMHRAQTPLTVYALDYFQVSLGSFMMILKQSYSVYALLRQVNSGAA